MKNSIIVMMLLFVQLFYGQKFVGKATYKTYQKMSLEMTNNKGKSLDDAFQKKIEDKFKKMTQKTYTLSFNESKSTYTQNKELQSQVQSRDIEVIGIGIGGDSDILFKDIAKKIYVNKKEVSGKNFLIKDSLSNSIWKMTSETKKIGKFTCYKTTKSREKERISYMMTDGEKVENKKKVTIITTAWYTPEIPVSNGPEKFGGLPGLILEIQDGSKTILCTELIINPSKKIRIEIPEKGKKVNQKEFDAILKKKIDEMLERYKNNRATKKGESMSIEIQG